MTNTKIPELLTGATIMMQNGEKLPCTIVENAVSNKTVGVQVDKFVRVDHNGFFGKQVYEISPANRGLKGKEIIEFTLRDSGKWVKKGAKSGFPYLKFGVREVYQDFSYLK